MIKRNVKNRHKVIKNRVGQDCPRCGHPLVYRINSATQKRFIGCSNFPKCDYKPQKSIVDYACESLGVNWRPNISREVFDIFYDITHGELEHISKIRSDENHDTSEVNEGKIVIKRTVIANQNATKVMKPGEQTLHFPTTLITA